MQIGDAQIEIVGLVAGEVAPRPEALRADEFEPRLEHEADIRIEAVNRRAPVDQEHRERADLLVAVGRGKGEQAGMGLERQAAARCAAGPRFPAPRPGCRGHPARRGGPICSFGARTHSTNGRSFFLRLPSSPVSSARREGTGLRTAAARCGSRPTRRAPRSR